MLTTIACMMVADIPFGPNSGSALPPAHAPNQVALADLDGDGVLDAIVPGRNTDRLIRWSLGTGGAPSFGPWRELELPTPADWAVVAPGAAATPDILLALRAYQGSRAAIGPSPVRPSSASVRRGFRSASRARWIWPT